MTNLQRRVSFYCAVLAAVCIIPSIALAVGPEDAEEWAPFTAISSSITSPADNTYLPINHIQNLTATANDCDKYRVGEQWYIYFDDVTSGNDETNFHLWWTCSGGGELLDEYSPIASYKAPDYSLGNNVRNITVTAHADDFNRTPDTYGYNDTSKQDSITLKIWQVHVAGRANGTVSTNYDGSHYDAPPYAGDQLGWVSHDNPENCWGYRGSFEFKGAIPSGPGVTTGYKWYNHKKGIKRHKEGGDWVTPYDYNQSTFENDWPSNYAYKDEDSRHDETDVREIFAIDDPGFMAGENNNNAIPPLTRVYFDMNYKCWVELNNIRISNECDWWVYFELEEDSGVWSVASYGLLTDS